jgi:hypothetical protein
MSKAQHGEITVSMTLAEWKQVYKLVNQAHEAHREAQLYALDHGVKPFPESTAEDDLTSAARGILRTVMHKHGALNK